MAYICNHDGRYAPIPAAPAGDLAPSPADGREIVSVPKVAGALFSAYVKAAHAIEIDPFAQLRKQRLPTRGFEEDDLAVPLDDLLDLIEHTARLAQRPEFALCVASATHVAALGPTALLAYAQPTVREAVTVLCSERRGILRALLMEHGEGASLQLFNSAAVARGDCAADLAPALAIRAMQGLLGPQWRPSRTELARTHPGNARPYEAFFGDVLFDQASDSIFFPRADLDRPSPLASPALARLVEHHLRLWDEHCQEPFAERVLETIEVLLPRGLCSVERVASQLHVHRRTVHRRLAEQGLTFSAMETSVRRRIVEAAVVDPRRPLAAIAQSAGFASAAAFSRWFSNAYGRPPQACRRASAKAAQARLDRL